MYRYAILILILALITATMSVPAWVSVAIRQSDSNTEVDPDTRCAVDAYPNISRFRYGSCATEYNTQKDACKDADDQSKCEQTAQDRRDLCETLCTTDDSAVERCAKRCERIHRSLSNDICAPIKSNATVAECEKAADDALLVCQNICVKYHKGLNDSSDGTDSGGTDGGGTGDGGGDSLEFGLGP